MQKFLYIITLAAILTGGCGHNHDHGHDHSHDHSHETGRSPGTLTAGSGKADGGHGHDHSHETGRSPGTLTAGSGKADGGHGHDHDDVKLLLTASGNRFEIFAEAGPLARGINSEMLVHVTRIADFKPLTDGRVTAILTAGGSTSRQTLIRPSSPGIYRFNLQPGSEGGAELHFLVETPGPAGDVVQALITDTIIIRGLHVWDDEHMAIHAAEDLIDHRPGAVRFTKEQSWVITFATGRAERRPFSTVIRTVGEVLPAQGDDIILTAQSPGIISFRGNDLYEGRSLRQGEPLLEVLGSSLAEGNAAIRYAEALNNYERTKADYERTALLAAEQIVSERELITATGNYRNALAVFNSIKENFSESGQTVSAPFSSYLGSLYVSSGQYVEAGAPLARISRLQRYVIKAEVQQRYAPLLGSIHSANLVTGGKTYSLDEMGGSVLSAAREVTPRSPLIPVHLRVDARPEIFPGTLLDVYLLAGVCDNALVVPNTALVEEHGNYFVYVRIHPESFEKREVFTGSSDGFFTEITGGLEENETIVTIGAVMVKAASTTGNIDANSGHVH